MPKREEGVKAEEEWPLSLAYIRSLGRAAQVHFRKADVQLTTQNVEDGNRWTRAWMDICEYTRELVESLFSDHLLRLLYIPMLRKGVSLQSYSKFFFHP